MNRLVPQMLTGLVLLLASGTSIAAERPLSLEDALGRVARELTRDLPRHATPTVAVATFRDADGNETPLGRYIAETLPEYLMRTGLLEPVERGRLDALLEELMANQGDLLAPGTLPRLGRLLGADTIVLGSVTDLETAVEVHARLIDTERRVLLGATTVLVDKDARLRMIDELAIDQRSGHAPTGPSSGGRGPSPPRDSSVTYDRSSDSASITGRPDRGEFVYRIHCAICHGERGDGQGEAAYRLGSVPRDFRQMTRGGAEVLDVIREGIPGTDMPGWKGILTRVQAHDVAAFVMQWAGAR